MEWSERIADPVDSCEADSLDEIRSFLGLRVGIDSVPILR